MQHVSVNIVNSAWAGDVRWVCSRAGWSGTPPHPPPPGSQAACTSCRFPEPFERRIGPTPLHTATRRSHHDGGTPCSIPAVLRVGLLKSPHRPAQPTHGNPTQIASPRFVYGSLPLHSQIPPRPSLFTPPSRRPVIPTQTLFRSRDQLGGSSSSVVGCFTSCF